MSRYLSLDWDAQQLHLAVVQVQRGQVRIEKALVLPQTQSPDKNNADALGKALKEQLKEAKLASLPVLVGIGRDKVILKEVKFPPVPAHEEPDVVKFQVVKELTESAGNVLFDYNRLPNQAGSNDRRASVWIVRKELVEAYRTLCKSAGLKLVGMTPRSFGILACVQHYLKNDDADRKNQAVAVLSIAENWAELCVVQGDSLLFSRSLNVGAKMLGELRRNLAVYAGQAPQAPIVALYVSGGEEHADFCASLSEQFDLETVTFDPLLDTKQELPEGTRSAFAGAVGLCLAPLPINYLHIKQASQPAKFDRQKVMLVALLFVAVFAAATLFGYYQVYRKDKLVAEARLRLKDLEDHERTLTPEAKASDAVNDWSRSTLVWLDELYDTTVMMPRHDVVKLTLWSGEPLRTTGTTTSKSKEKEKEQFPGRVTLKGKTTQEHRKLLDEWRDSIKKDSAFSPPTLEILQNTSQDRKAVEFQIPIMTKFRLSEEFTRLLDPKMLASDKPPPKPPEKKPEEKPKAPEFNPAEGPFPNFFGGVAR